MDGYLSKPMKADTLQKAIENCLPRLAETAAVKVPDGALATTSGQRPEPFCMI